MHTSVSHAHVPFTVVQVQLAHDVLVCLLKRCQEPDSSSSQGKIPIPSQIRPLTMSLQAIKRQSSKTQAALCTLTVVLSRMHRDRI